MDAHPSTPVDVALPAGVAVALLASLALPGSAGAQADTLSLEELRRLGEVDSAYATPALRDFVGRAAEANRRLPELLESYGVRAETEVSILQAGPDGEEVVLQLEQIASDVAWRRGLPTVQRVVGYRSRSVGLVPSALSMFEVPWVVPTLYGDRIDLVRWSVPTVDDRGRVRRRRALHPLGDGRASVYRFSGGDTVLTLTLPERTLRLVRVEVEPVRSPDRPTLLFEGHLDIDAARHQIVRMRGRMISSDPDPGVDERLLGAAFTGATFVDFESAEYDGRFWLPRSQRIEVQAASRFTGTRIALRLVTRFGAPDLDRPGELARRHPDPPPGGLLLLEDATRRSDFAGWDFELGEVTGEANVLDFRDVDPGRRAASGGPWVGFGVRHFTHLVRFNDPEGVFTGAGIVVRPGRAWREGRIRLHGGWAWREGTARGGVAVAHVGEESRWEWLLRAERGLRTTADFSLFADGVRDAPALAVGEDEILYDHRTVGLVAREPRGSGWAWRFEAGRGEDATAGGLRAFAPGGDPTGDGAETAAAAVAEGGYWLGRVDLVRNGAATGYGVSPGTSLRLAVEGGVGELEWLRLEAGVGTRRTVGDLSLEGRADGGLTLADDPPPQRLFELGRFNGLPGYRPRAFAGDRVVLVRTAVAYTLPFLRRPLGGGGFYLPAVAPAPAVTLRAGWTDATGSAGALLERAGAVTTDGIRATVGLHLRLFGGGVSVGAARPLDAGGDWRFVWSLAREF